MLFNFKTNTSAITTTIWITRIIILDFLLLLLLILNFFITSRFHFFHSNRIRINSLNYQVTGCYRHYHQGWNDQIWNDEFHLSRSRVVTMLRKLTISSCHNVEKINHASCCHNVEKINHFVKFVTNVKFLNWTESTIDLYLICLKITYIKRKFKFAPTNKA